MEEALARQALLRRKILRSLENFRKVGKDNLTLTKLQARISSLQATWDAFQEGHISLDASTPAADQLKVPYFVDAQVDSTEDAFIATKEALLDALDEFQPPVSSPASPVANALVPVPRPALALSHLPPVQLLPFSGDSNQWETFRDRFISIILSNPDLDDFTRIHYLASSLRGPALAVLDDIALTAANLAEAWRALSSRYENKRKLIRLHLENLIELAPVKRESAVELLALRNRANVAITSLKKLDRSPEQLWTDMIVLLVSKKLDPMTLKAWTFASSPSGELSTYDDLAKFIDSRARALDELADTVSPPSQSKSFSPRVHAAITATTSDNAPTISACPLCESRHFLSSCSLYLAKPLRQRYELVTQLSRCFNCLSERHSAKDCPSKYTCRKCHQHHHSSLHDDSKSIADSSAVELPPSPSLLSGDPNVASLSATTHRRSPSRVLLATAWIKVRSSSGRTATVRALVDQGSEVSLIAENLVQLLKAKRLRRNITISAVGGAPVDSVRSAVSIEITPVNSPAPTLTTSALVLTNLTSYRSHRSADPSSFSHLSGLQWADVSPTSSDPIQVILGADLYCEIILEGIQKGITGCPIAQNSIFGWIISGPLPSPPSDLRPSVASNVSVHMSSVNFASDSSSALSLDSELRRFWEIEELPRRSLLTPMETQCEDHFRATHSRSLDGRFVVRLPFAHSLPPELGFSRNTAERVFHSLTRKFRSDSSLEQEYSEFMSEYRRLGHMRCESDSRSHTEAGVYIPHHPVFRAESTTSHLRVVFNASCPTSNGRSLNDSLLPGPKLQTDLSAVILRWRQPRHVCTADVEKMYRQILVDPRDAHFQKILWFGTASKAPVDHTLLTVTYGMTCAPFLALRVIQQLVELDGHQFPLAVQILRDQIYVDDVLFGADDLTTLRRKRDQVIGLLRRGHFKLRKWASNSATLLSDIDASNHGLACTKTLAADDHVNVLGIGWNPALDVFQIHTALLLTPPCTKRSILSTIAKIYDPLGWVTPVTISAKILMQDLWRLRISWDDSIPATLLTRWTAIHSGLSRLNNLTLRRWTGLDANSRCVELHGFCDASSNAYAAVVYLKIVSASEATVVSLLAGKSKVAPLSPLSIPRLELSAALLLARLLEFLRPLIDSTKLSCCCWTDSTIVLAWLRDHPSRWKTFVANRTQEIHTRVPDAKWRHVPTEDNPADCASRGILGEELEDHPLWWTGPSWLFHPQTSWPSETSSFAFDSSVLEEKLTVSHTSSPPEPWDLSSRYSSWPKLVRVTGYLFRFLRLLRSRLSPPDHSAQLVGLSVDDCSRARTFWLKRVQLELFPSEIYALSHGHSLSTKSPALPLRPFFDRDGVLRVGGRLRNSPTSFSCRHPILLSSHPITALIVQQAHSRTLHGGVQLALNTLRQEFWILRGRSVVKHILHQCVRCTREKALVPEQLMGNLPSARVTPSSRPFSHCGIDYAGPVQTRASAGRGIVSRKSYIALFVCLSTRAIHLELVGDYSAVSFTNAFSRFCSRRGLPSDMYSDNGTTFVGASKELRLAYRAALQNPDFLASTACDNVSWHFIPPAAPHFGGLWEAGVRSVKYHLRRVLGDHTLTFEEFSTLLTQVEACLNSRPIAPLYDSFDSLEVLTPGHFLIGSALNSAPEPSLLDLNENRLSRWQHVRRLVERFWRLWQVEYVNTLQSRTRWRKESPSLKPGQLVLIRNANLPPCKWELGRITLLHPGTDGLSRVVTVRTAYSEFKRPLSQLCVLPVAHAVPSDS